MSGGSPALKLSEDDVRYLLTAKTHIGTTNMNHLMGQYVFKRRNDGVHLIDLRKTWEKILLAARAIVAVENSSDICVISCSTGGSAEGTSRPLGQRAVLKFAKYTGATPIAGRYTPGTFTNQIQKVFREPRLLVVCDPHADHQPIEESSYSNIPVIAFCNTDAPLHYVDIAIPCNNKAQHSIGLVWWMLTREVLRMRGVIPRDIPWDVKVDMFIYREPEEVKKEEQAAAAEAAKTAIVTPAAIEAPASAAPGETADYVPVQETWAEAPTKTVGATDDWARETTDTTWTTTAASDWAAT